MKFNKTLAKVLAVAVVLSTVAAGMAAFQANAVSSQPKVVAFYQDSLATKLTSAGTSMTLVRGTDSQSRVISGYLGFVIDEGTASQETVLGTAVGTSITGLIRGVDVANGTTSVAANIKDHARGASVKVTTWPSLGIINNQLAGIEGISVPIFYQSLATTSIAANRDFLASVGLVQDIAFNGAAVINAATTNKGIVQLSTGIQTASSTATGSTGALLVIPSSLATSTYNAATAALKVVVTNNAGAIDSNFITSVGSTTKVGSTYALDIGKGQAVFYSTGTTTWTVPNGIRTVRVRAIGPGGTSGTDGSGKGSGGGGSGGYAEAVLDVSATSSLQVAINTAITQVNGGLITANIGTNGGNGANPAGAAGGGNGGTAATSTATGVTFVNSFTAAGGPGGWGFYDGTHSSALYGPGGTTAFGGSTYGTGGGGGVSVAGNKGIVIIDY